MVICCLFWVVKFIWDRKLWLVQNYGCRRGLSENSELVKQAGAEVSQAQPQLKLMLRLNYIFIMTVDLSKWWKFRTLIKLNYSDENSSHWWKNIVHCDETLTLKWQFICVWHIISVVTIHYCSKNLLLWT